MEAHCSGWLLEGSILMYNVWNAAHEAGAHTYIMQYLEIQCLGLKKYCLDQKIPFAKVIDVPVPRRTLRQRVDAAQVSH